MALKFKAPFGPGVSSRNKAQIPLRGLRRSLHKKGMIVRQLPSGKLGIFRVKKGSTVKTPRRTSRGVSF